MEKHEFLNFCQQYIRYRKNENFRGLIYGGARSFYFQKLGDKNIGKIVFIFEPSESLGFFAAYRGMINWLYLCDQFGFVPVGHFSENWSYSEKNKVINEKKDYFEQYFEQLSDISYEDAIQSNAVVQAGSWQQKYFEKQFENVDFSYNPPNDYLKNISKYSKKYIRPNPILKNQLDDEIKKLLQGKKTLAVHVRIQVFQLKINGHPIPETLDSYIKDARRAVDECKFEQIFLATEEAETIEAFRREFEDAVVYYNDVFRTETGGTQILESDRENHHYRLGYEVMRDMYTLARCEGIIAGESQISICAQITKYENDSEYEFKKIYNNGLYETNVMPDDSIEIIREQNK